MSRLLRTVSLTMAALSANCSTEPTNGVTPPDCENEKAALVEFIEDNGSCATDDDCQYAQSWCLLEGRVDCTGAFYFNRSVTAEQFAELDDVYSNCVSADSASDAAENCGTCLKGSLTPICDAGTCVPGPED